MTGKSLTAFARLFNVHPTNCSLAAHRYTYGKIALTPEKKRAYVLSISLEIHSAETIEPNQIPEGFHQRFNLFNWTYFRDVLGTEKWSEIVTGNDKPVIPRVSLSAEPTAASDAA